MFDFKDVKGQFAARRAAEVAASGMHNFIMIGSPGSGKTMIARRMPSILPPMTLKEALNSSISSRNRIPLLAMLTLPGLAFVPPPITAILLDVWWGLTNGLLFISLPLSLIRPATEWLMDLQEGESSADIRCRVINAHKIQAERLQFCLLLQ